MAERSFAGWIVAGVVAAALTWPNAAGAALCKDKKKGTLVVRPACTKRFVPASADDLGLGVVGGGGLTLGSAGLAIAAGGVTSDKLAARAVTPAMIGSVPAAVVTNTGDISVAGGGTHNLISFDTDQVNIDGMHSTTSNPSRLTAPIDGLYEIHGEANWFPCSNTGTFEEIEIYVNGTTRVGVTEIPNSTAACVVEGVNALVRLHAGDYVQLFARQSSGSAETIRGTNSEGAPDTPEFDMHWVGPSS
jgi:hypothetical protein